MTYKILHEKDPEKRLEYWRKIFGTNIDGSIVMPPIIDLSGTYTDPGSFCYKCKNLVIHDRYCTNCGKKNENYGIWMRI